MNFYNKTTLFIVSIFLSILIHSAEFGVLSLVYKTKKPIFTSPTVIEIIPYYTKDIKPLSPPDQNTRFFGPKDMKTGQENKLPALKSIIPKTPDIIEKITPDSLPTALPTQKKDQTEQKKEDDIIAFPKIEEPIKEEKKQAPLLKQLIPKETDLLARLPKEESINLNTGSVRGSKELILNTKEYKYWSYLEKVKRKVESVWQYPEVARERGIGGQLKISFSISRDGNIEHKTLIESSSLKILDDAAMKALRDASPLPPFPKGWDIDKLNIDGTFIYVINVIR